MRFSLKTLGPGLLFAGAAIGVSHLVQSTRAGAEFGFGFIWALLLINVVKYPFFSIWSKICISYRRKFIGRLQATWQTCFDNLFHIDFFNHVYYTDCGYYCNCWFGQ